MTVRERTEEIERITLSPVSYTHLDVYKRQHEDWVLSITIMTRGSLVLHAMGERDTIGYLKICSKINSISSSLRCV